MAPILIISAIGLAALAAAAALVYFIGKGAEHTRARTMTLAAGFVLAMVVASGVTSYASVYYIKPVGWIVAIAAVWMVVLGLFVLIGMDVKWRPSRVAALLGLFFASSVLFFAIGMADLVGPPMHLFEIRASQIARANGFDVLVPSGRKLHTDYLPVDPLPTPDAGVSLSYQEFQLEERKAAKPTTEGDLEKLVALGTRPFAGAEPVPADAKLIRYTVQGAPAVAVEYSYVPKGGASGAPPATLRAVALVTVLDGVDVRLSSGSGERESNGQWVPYPGLTADELAKIAQTLGPVR